MILDAAKRIRHSKILKSQSWLWDALRGPYHRLIDPWGKGTKISIAGVCEAFVPGDMTGMVDWRNYEKETLGRMTQVLQESRQAEPLVVDVGSSIGVFSLAALATHPRAQVIAIDSDLPSLMVLQKLTQHYVGHKVSLIRGLISERADKESRLPEAIQMTRQELETLSAQKQHAPTQFICLNDPNTENIQTYSLDQLFANYEISKTSPVVLKIDVEGAEMLVLKGAHEFIRRNKPTIFMSAHPPTLPRYGHSVDLLQQELSKLGYRTETIAVDHEIHWLCLAQEA
jgi:FkbM family methyltransferase